MFKADVEQAEVSPSGMIMAKEVAVRIQEKNGAALVIDYGEEGSSKHTFRVQRISLMIPYCSNMFLSSSSGI